MKWFLLLCYNSCFDCIYYKEPSFINNLRRFNDVSKCTKYNDYAEICRHDEKKCGLHGKEFSPRFKKLKHQNVTKF
jgi:hypothetical protein